MNRNALRAWASRIFAGAMLSGLCLAAAAGEAVLDVTGESGTVRAYSIEDLGRLPTVTVRAANDHQGEGSYTGVELHELLRANGVPQGDKLRGKHLAEYVVVSARDGYRVVFSLAELDPAFAGDRKILVAWSRDGNPLPGAEGVLRVIVPSERHPTRWIRQVSAIRLQAAREAPGP